MPNDTQTADPAEVQTTPDGPKTPEAAEAPEAGEAPEAAEASSTPSDPEHVESAAESDAEPADLPADEAAPDGPPEDGPPEDVTGDGAEASAAKEKPAAKPKRARKKPVGPPPPPEQLPGAVEALLLAAGDVLRVERIRDLLGLPSIKPVHEALDTIRARWEAAGLAAELEEVAGGVRVVTRPEYAEYVSRLGRRPTTDKLSRGLLETLSIVAYKQPVGRAEVERVRGVQAGEALRALLERQLLKVVGRSDLPGRPLLYGTTQRFLTVYGLRDLKDLPSAKELQRM